MEEVLTKACTDCGEEKPITEYHKLKTGKYGVTSRCKSCAKIRKKAYNEANKEKIKAYNESYYAEKKDFVREIQKAYYEENSEQIKANVRKWERENPERKAENQTKYRKEKPELHQARQKRYKLNNPDRVRELGVKHTQTRRARMRELVYDLTEEQWQETLKEFNHSCAYCGKTECKLEQEHIIPVTSDGGYTKHNIIPACKSCNVSKHDTELAEWYKKQDYFSEEKLLKVLEFSEYYARETTLV